MLTLGSNVVSFILNHTYCQTVVGTSSEVDNLCEAKEKSNVGKGTALPYFSTIIVVNGPTLEASRRAQSAGLKILSFEKVEAVGAHRITTEGFCHSPPSPEDIATFCYTSGTTGNPKGALITHKSFIAYAAAAKYAAKQVQSKLGDRHLSYLPLANILERVYVFRVMAYGGSIPFFRGDLTLLIEDIQACRPSFMVAVPRVLTRIHDKVLYSEVYTLMFFLYKFLTLLLFVRKIIAGVEVAGGRKKSLCYVMMLSTPSFMD